jgi:Cdc6-like AAA superfamily ATPase
MEKEENGMTDNVRKAIALIEEFHAHSKRSPQCMTITGPSGCGKTTAIRTYMKENASGTNSKILYSSIPIPTSVKSIAERLLNQLGDPTPHKGTVSWKTERLVQWIKNNALDLVILDEVENLLGYSRPPYELVDWIRFLMDETQVPFVFFGLEDAKRVIQMNDKLSRRCWAQHSLTAV